MKRIKYCWKCKTVLYHDQCVCIMCKAPQYGDRKRRFMFAENLRRKYGRQRAQSHAN